MTEIPETLRSLYHAAVEQDGDRYLLKIPASELKAGTVEESHHYRVALFPAPAAERDGSEQTQPAGEDREQRDDQPTPPVSPGDERTVDIETLGDQGDGIARVERGYVVVVPGAEEGERVTIRITDVKPTVAFSEILSREDYYE